MLQLLKEEFLMIIAVILLGAPLFLEIYPEAFAVYKMLLWIIFWFYLFKAFRIDRNWAMLFGIPVIIYNPIVPMNYTNDVWGIISGFFLIVAISWLLKRARPIFKNHVES